MKLAACKWCNNKAPVFAKDIESRVWVECPKCGANSWRRENEKMAAEIWAVSQFEGAK